MASFATEADVRLKFQLDDATLVPSTLVVGSIDDAHEELLRFLDPQFDTTPAEEAVVMGETLLAGAHLFRTLAAKDAFDQKQATIGGQRLEAGKRFTALMAVAALTEDQAWYVLEPYIEARPSRVLAAVTDTVPVLGEE